MAQDRAQAAIAPFIALCTTAKSPRAAADLITQATSAPNAYTFADLLAQPNIQALKTAASHSASYTLLEIFAWGTWETYVQSTPRPTLTGPQELKLRLLSLLTYATQKKPDLSYATLCSRLQLSSAVDVEHLVTTAIYSELLAATFNPASKTVHITSVAPVRDLAPGSVQNMLKELEQWSGRCDSVLADLEAEIARVKSDAQKRAAKSTAAQKQLAAATEANESKTAASTRPGIRSQKPVQKQRRQPGDNEDDDGDDDDDDDDREDEDESFVDDDAMDIDGQQSGGQRKAAAAFMNHFRGK